MALEYLQASPTSQIQVIGGSAAIADSIIDQLRPLTGMVVRIAGVDRFDTADELTEYGLDSPPRQLTLVDIELPNAWVAGLAAASFAARADAPIVLTSGGMAVARNDARFAGCDCLRT